MNTYTVCQLALNANATYSVVSLPIRYSYSETNKQHLDCFDDMWNWVLSVYGRFASIRIVNDQTGEVREYTDNGTQFERVL